MVNKFLYSAWESCEMGHWSTTLQANLETPAKKLPCTKGIKFFGNRISRITLWTSLGNTFQCLTTLIKKQNQKPNKQKTADLFYFVSSMLQLMPIAPCHVHQWEESSLLISSPFEYLYIRVRSLTELSLAQVEQPQLLPSLPNVRCSKPISIFIIFIYY